jgi:hypothetical protein
MRGACNIATPHTSATTFEYVPSGDFEIIECGVEMKTVAVIRAASLY